MVFDKTSAENIHRDQVQGRSLSRKKYSQDEMYIFERRAVLSLLNFSTGSNGASPSPWYILLL